MHDRESMIHEEGEGEWRSTMREEGGGINERLKARVSFKLFISFFLLFLIHKSVGRSVLWGTT